MSDQNKIWKYLQKQLSPEETRSVETWINETESNRKDFEELRSIWIESENLEDIKLFIPKAGLLTISTMTAESKPKTRLIVRWIGIAASILLISSIVILYLIHKPAPIDYFVASEENTSLRLSDGSMVYLEKSGSIKFYPDEDHKSRTVRIFGKARFNIFPDSIPFVVEAGKTGVKVLGTVFEVDILDTNEVTVENLEGLIRFYELRNETNAITMQAGEKFTFNGSSFIDRTKAAEQVKESGEILSVEQLINKLFIKFDGQFNTGPYGKFDLKDSLRVDLNNSLDEIIKQLESKAMIKYRKTCSNCYEISELILPN